MHARLLSGGISNTQARPAAAAVAAAGGSGGPGRAPVPLIDRAWPDPALPRRRGSNVGALLLRRQQCASGVGGAAGARRGEGAQRGSESRAARAARRASLHERSPGRARPAGTGSAGLLHRRQAAPGRARPARLAEGGPRRDRECRRAARAATRTAGPARPPFQPSCAGPPM
jgi:hypothetical protein